MLVEDLKPCPFCGGYATYSANKFRPPNAYIYCTECKSRNGDFSGLNEIEAIKSAIEAWNKRGN